MAFGGPPTRGAVVNSDMDPRINQRAVKFRDTLFALAIRKMACTEASTPLARSQTWVSAHKHSLDRFLSASEPHLVRVST
jgi:hypothetical protein